MTDYYDELGLGRTCTVAEINETLSELEAKWIRRETVNPDEARKVLTNISDAKKVFKDEASKREYDRSLSSSSGASVNTDPAYGGSVQSYNGANPCGNTQPYNSGNVVPGNVQPTGTGIDQQDIDRWIRKTIKYCNAKKYDLAAGSIEHIFERTRPSERSDDLYGVAAEIYGNMGRYDQAMDYINKALAMKPLPLYYNRKANICLSKMMESSRNEADKLQMQMQYALEDALKLENKKTGKSNKQDKSITYGLYAAMYWRNDVVNAAKENAEKAIQLGDKSGYGRQVQAFIKRRKSIGRYKVLMPIGYVVFFIVNIATAALLFVTGGTVGTIMVILSLCATGLLNYLTGAYPYGGRSIVWGIVLSCLFGAGLACLYGYVYALAVTPVIFVFTFYVVLAVALYIVGRNQRKKLLEQ